MQLPLSDQINFGMAIAFVIKVIEKRLKIQFKNEVVTNSLNELNIDQIKIFFMLLGSELRTLTFSLPFETESYLRELIYAKIISHYCRHMEHFQCSGWSISDEGMKYISVLKKLKSLTLMNNFDVTGKYDVKFRNEIKINFFFSGEYICNMRNLINLTLLNCTRIKSEKMCQIFNNLKNLVYLDTRFCHLTKKNFKTIVDNLLMLKSFKFNTSHEDYNGISQLKSLEALEICMINAFSPPLSKSFFNHLVKHKAKQISELILINRGVFNSDIMVLCAKLKTLKLLYICGVSFDNEIFNNLIELTELRTLIISYSYFISNDQIIEILQRCQYLRHLKVTSCRTLTSELFPKIIKSLNTHHRFRIDGVCKRLKIFEIMEFEMEIFNDGMKISYKYMQPDEYEYKTNTLKINSANKINKFIINVL